MEILDYYDDEIVKKEACFFNRKKITGIFITFCLATVLSIINMFRILIPDNVNVTSAATGSIFFIVCWSAFTIFFMVFLDRKDMELLSEEELNVLKDEYELKRQNILKEHQYNFSIFTIYWDYIEQEILCDSFSVDNKGYAYILNSDSDFVINETENKKPYHHIVDNRDGHILTVKELIKRMIKEEK